MFKNKIKKSFNTLLVHYKATRYLINLNKKSKDTSFKIKTWCFLHGFSSEKYTFYDFENNNYKFYLSDFQRYKTQYINAKYSLLLDDKEVFEKLLRSKNITTKIYGTINNGKIYLNDIHTPIEEFINLLKSKGKLVIKIRTGGGGNNIFKLEDCDNGIFLNDKRISIQDLNIFINSLNNYLILEHLSQADYAKRIYPGTINTIRIVTMIDPKTNEVIIPMAIHKFGSEKTKPADNVWRGGMTAQVDINSGILKKSLLHSEHNRKVIMQEFHPDTNERIEGTTIPNWNRVIKQVKELALSVNFIKYVGWDVVVTNDGIKIIEGNNCSDVNILQIHEPLLENEKVKDFYRYYKII